MSCCIWKTVLFLKREIKRTIEIITGQLKNNNTNNNNDDYDRAETNKPFPSSPGLLYQNKVKCSAFDMEMIFYFLANKTHFHKKGYALGLILKVKVFGTRK